jgi:hypothetical protein
VGSWLLTISGYASIAFVLITMGKGAEQEYEYQAYNLLFNNPVLDMSPIHGYPVEESENVQGERVGGARVGCGGGLRLGDHVGRCAV